MSLELNIVINKIQRMPFPKIQEMLRDNKGSMSIVGVEYLKSILISAFLIGQKF